MYPELKYLMIIMKELLKSRELNDLNTGGMSSFVLMILQISYFQDIFKEGSNYEMLLSEHLLNFLSLYGTKFNYKHLGISLRAGG